MSRVCKVLLLLTAALLLTATSSLSQAAKPPTFTAQDRELIEAYYKRIIGTLAPGSLDRSPLPFGVEQALVVGSRIQQLKSELERLPAKLESQLSAISSDYGRYKLGRHILLLKKDDFAIADILKNVAIKGPEK